MLPQGLSRSTGQQRSMVELVRQEMGLKREPPTRGCGCLASVVVVLTVVLAVLLALALLRCEYSPDDSTTSGNQSAAITESRL